MYDTAAIQPEDMSYECVTVCSELILAIKSSHILYSVTHSSCHPHDIIVGNYRVVSFLNVIRVSYRTLGKGGFPPLTSVPPPRIMA